MFTHAHRGGHATLQGVGVAVACRAVAVSVGLRVEAGGGRRRAVAHEARSLARRGAERGQAGRGRRAGAAARRPAAHERRVVPAEVGHRALPRRAAEAVHGRVSAPVATRRPLVVVEVVVHRLLEAVRRTRRLLLRLRLLLLLSVTRAGTLATAAGPAGAGAGHLPDHRSAAQGRAPALQVPVRHLVAAARVHAAVEALLAEARTVLLLLMVLLWILLLLLLMVGLLLLLVRLLLIRMGRRLAHRTAELIQTVLPLHWIVGHHRVAHHRIGHHRVGHHRVAHHRVAHHRIAHHRIAHLTAVEAGHLGAVVTHRVGGVAERREVLLLVLGRRPTHAADGHARAPVERAGRTVRAERLLVQHVVDPRLRRGGRRRVAAAVVVRVHVVRRRPELGAHLLSRPGRDGGGGGRHRELRHEARQGRQRWAHRLRTCSPACVN